MNGPGTHRWRVLIAKPGLDGHERGVQVIAKTLRDAGMEVIYTGLFQTPQRIAATAIDEDVDAVGMSILSGAHMTLLPAVVDELRRRGGQDILVFAGGIIPAHDIPALNDVGIDGIFTPGASLRSIVEWLEAELSRRHEISS